MVFRQHHLCLELPSQHKVGGQGNKLPQIRSQQSVDGGLLSLRYVHAACPCGCRRHLEEPSSSGIKHIIARIVLRHRTQCCFHQRIRRLVHPRNRVLRHEHVHHRPHCPIFPHTDGRLDVEVTALQLIGCTLPQHANTHIPFVGKMRIAVRAIIRGWSVAIARTKLQLPCAGSLIPESGVRSPEIQRSLGIDIPLIVQ